MRANIEIIVAALLTSACQTDPPSGELYFERVIQPILTQSCVNGSSGCHAVNHDDPYAFSGGNLDLTSFENVHKRPDLLRTYGSYTVPMLLLKAAADPLATTDLSILYRDRSLPSRIQHAGGRILAVGSPAFLTLQSWLADGATENGVKKEPGPVAGEGPCPTTVPPGFDPATVTSTAAWSAHAAEFDAVQAIVVDRGCAAATCHGAPASDFYFTCGGDAKSKAFNFYQVQAFVATPVDRSPILTIPAIGSAHTGGVYFMGTDDPDYKTVHDFAAAVGELPTFGAGDEGKTFFADNVMPVLLQRGCAAEGCHSPAVMNDLKLRAGSLGAFSPVALARNYTLALEEFMALEMPDPRRARLLAKTILPEHGGISHRGGALLDDGAGANPAACPASYDPATATPFCTIVQWAKIERRARGNPNGDGKAALVYVERAATHLAGPLEFAIYQPGSDLLVRDVTLDANGAIGNLSAPRSVLGGCPGAADRSVVDVRGPDVKNDGDSIAFAMRTSASDTLHLYTVHKDGSGCTPVAHVAGAHDFDPAWSPDDGSHLVFASTRAGGTSLRTGQPQSDLWRVAADGSDPQRMTFLSNSEVSPQFMRMGRLTMSTEKVDAADPKGGFYQISGRRLNWDNTDYHPLLAQRSISPTDFAAGTTMRRSIGYQQATEIREGADGNFLLVLSDEGTRGGAGILGIFNRSIGPVEIERTDPGYLRSLTTSDPALGAFRSPFLLPDGRILASYVAAPGNLATVTSIDWDLVAYDPRAKTVTPLVTGAGAQVEAVLAIEAPARSLYSNHRQLVFGGGQDTADLTHAHVYVTDAPMIGTLLAANLRRGRFVDELAGADHLDIFDATGAPVTSVPLAADGSIRLRVPSGFPVYLGLSKGKTPILRMTEEHQFGPGEHISLGVRREVFNHVCGGCHGSVSGREIDVSVSADALTGASASLSFDAAPVAVGP